MWFIYYLSEDKYTGESCWYMYCSYYHWLGRALPSQLVVYIIPLNTKYLALSFRKKKGILSSHLYLDHHSGNETGASNKQI